MLSISPSKMRSADCLHYFHEMHVVKKDESREGPETAVNLLEGRFGHEVAEKYSKALLEKKLDADFELFLQIFDQCWEGNKYIPESHYEGLKEFLHSFGEVHSIDPKYLWGVEVMLALNKDLKKVDWKAPDAWLRMKLDEITVKGKTAIIKDFKTQFYVPSEGEMKKNLQTLIYPFGLALLNPKIEEFIMLFYYMRWNKTQSFKFTREEVMLIEPRLRSFTERMEKKIANPASEWPALRGEACGICHLACPLAELGLEPIRTPERALEAAMQVEALEAKRKKLRDELKDYCKPGRPVETNLGIYGWHPSSTIRGLKADKIADYCIEQGLDLNMFLKPATDKIKAFDDDEIKQAVLGMGKESFSTRFGLEKKAKTEDDKHKGGE